MYEKKDLIKGMVVIETLIVTWEMMLEKFGDGITFKQGESYLKTINNLQPLLEFVKEKIEELE